MWFPKEQSNEIVNMVVELNFRLGGAYFTVSFVDGGYYRLNPTKMCLAKRKFGYISFGEGGVTYGEMYSYIDGLLKGIRAQSEKV